MEKKNRESPSKSKSKKEKSSGKKIIIAVILVAFAFFGSFMIYKIMQISLNTEYPMVVVISPSMEPNIHTGDLLFLHGVDDPATIRNGSVEAKDGDVIVYNAIGLWSNPPQEPIVHRVVDKWYNASGWFFLTKGDANDCIDPPNSCVENIPVPADHIIGVVVGDIPYIGWVKIVLADSGLLIPIVVILSILLVISIIWDFVKEDKKNPDLPKKEEKQKEIREYDY